MRNIDQIYINGKFVKPIGTETLDLINPTTKQVTSRVILGNEQDTQNAIAAAKTAFRTFSLTTKEQRIEILQRLFKAFDARKDEMRDVMIAEYGGTFQVATASANRAAMSFSRTIDLLKKFEFVKNVGTSKVFLQPHGVVGIITPWNASAGFITSKFATALAAGSTVVVKPSELSAWQTQILLECIHEAELPPGLFNLVNGRGEVVGSEMTRHPDIAKISFTGSTLVGKAIARGAVETMKRVTLELGGKSPNILLDDADFEKAIPTAVIAATFNNGQACLAGTRLLVPAGRLDEVKRLVKKAAAAIKVGDPAQPDTAIGPQVTEKQFNRVQDYIRKGIEEGAELIVGGIGNPPGLESGYFTKLTVFANVTNDMTIARDEIFGPVLSIITYETEAEAIEIANDTIYGLHAYVSGSLERANRVASQIVAGRIFINGLYDDPEAPFGGFKQSGIGREFGTYGLEEYLEPKAVLGFNTPA